MPLTIARWGPAGNPEPLNQAHLVSPSHDKVSLLWSLFAHTMKALHYPAERFHRPAQPMATSAGQSEILTIREVAEYLKVTQRTIYRLAAAKKIPAFKVGGTWRFRKVDIDGWIATQSNSVEGQAG